MGVLNGLRRLDRRVVPVMGSWFYWLGAQRWRRRMAVAVVALASVGVVLAATWSYQQRPVAVDDVAPVSRVGVGVGDDVDAYVAEARDELAALQASGTDIVDGEPTWALVSLSEYASPDQVAAILDDAATVKAFTRVPLDRGDTAILSMDVSEIPADLVAGMELAASQMDQDAEESRLLAAALTGDGDTERDRRAGYLAAADLAEAEAEAYRQLCSCVYATVVRATPKGLADLAEAPEVAVVDPAPEIADMNRTVFTPLLPEQVPEDNPDD